MTYPSVTPPSSTPAYCAGMDVGQHRPYRRSAASRTGGGLDPANDENQECRVKKMIRVAALTGALALTLGACASAPEEETPGAEGTAGSGSDFKACMVSDEGGFDDASFNQSGFEGLERAEKELGIEIRSAESSDPGQYTANVDSMVQESCDLIIGVGFALEDAIQAAAEANPDLHFALVDSAFSGEDFAPVELENAKPLLFNTQEAAFLAGYLAAGYSKSGKVATFGGLNIPPVTVFMDGFADGVAHYNKTKSKNVQVLGWDKAKQNGTFAENFGDPNKGKALTSTFVAQGADVILPVAGGTGLGAGDVALASAGKVSVIWVDQDGCKNAEKYCEVFLTTVVKNIEDAVKTAVVTGAKGEKLEATPGYLGDLGNNGVSLAPYNKFDSKVDAGLKAEIDKLKADIVAGTIKVTSANAPK